MEDSVSGLTLEQVGLATSAVAIVLAYLRGWWYSAGSVAQMRADLTREQAQMRADLMEQLKYERDEKAFYKALSLDLLQTNRDAIAAATKAVERVR